MAPPDTWLPHGLPAALWLGAMLGWAVTAVWFLVRPRAAIPLRLQAVFAALAAASALPLANAEGWWADMPRGNMLIPVGLLAATLAFAGCRVLAGRLAALALAAFHVVLGLVSIRNGGPLPAFAGLMAMLLGSALLLLPPAGAVRLRASAVLLLLAATAFIAAHRDIPFA